MYLVLWYRQDDKTPIYSYDSRTGSPDLWSEPSVFGQRAVFRDYNGARPAVLNIKEVSKENDEANPLVCVHHVQLLRDVKGLVDQWGKVYLFFKFCHN